MADDVQSPLKRGLIAGGVGGVLLLVVSMVLGVDPEHGTTPAASPPPPVALEPAPTVPAPTEPPAPVATSPADPTLPAPSFVPTEPAAPAEGSIRVPAPTLALAPPAEPAAPDASRSAAPPAAPSTGDAAPSTGDAPTAPGEADTPRGSSSHGARSERATNPAAPKRVAVANAAYSPESLVVKFASLDDLDALLASGDVDVILEYADGKRYRLPRQLGAGVRALAVPDAEFSRVASGGHVTELHPGPELRARVGLSASNVRFLAVLGPRLAAMVRQELVDDTPRTVTVSAGPRVESRLASR